MVAVGQASASGLAAPEVLAFVLADLVLIVAVARAVGALARRLGQPTVAGEIVAGILLGPTLLGPALAGWARPWSFLRCDLALAVAPGTAPSVSACLFPPQARSVLGLIGQLALALFMLLVGLDFHPERLRGQARGVLSLAAGAVVAPVAGGLLLGPLLYDARFVGGFGTGAQPSLLAFQLTIGALLSVTAFPVMAHILREKGLSQGLMGTVALAAAAIVTVCTFLLLAAGAAVDGGGLGGVARRVVAVGSYLAVMWYAVRPALARLGPRLEAAGKLGPTAFAAVLALGLASALVAHVLGVTVIVGAFVAGVVLPARDLLRAELSARLADVTVVVLLPVFLAFSGLLTDFTLLDGATVGGIVALLAAGVLGKWAAGAAAARLGGLSWRDGNLAGVLMNCRGLLPLVVAVVALEQGLITAELQLGAVVMALVTTMMTGPLFDAFLRRREAVPEAAAAPQEPAAGRVSAPAPPAVPGRTRP